MSEQIIIPTPGDLVAGKYRIERELGRGAYGVVFLATQEGIDRKVAIKTLLPKAFFEEGIVARFEREAKFVGRLDHPNVVRVFDYGRHDQLLYMAVEYIEGRGLEELIESEAPLSPSRTRALVYQIVDALKHAHERGIVHRDLKPSNILILEEPDPTGELQEVVKVLDFGIAKLVQEEEDESLGTLTQAGTVLGTPHYMSPESIVGDEVAPTTDIYALGVIIFEMLTGRRPFPAKNSPAVMVRHLRDDPPPLPPHLEDSCWGEVVRKCLEKQPRFRIEEPEQIRAILRREDEQEPPEWWERAAPTEQMAYLETMQHQRPVTTEQRDAHAQSSGRPRAIGAVMLGVLVGALVAVAFWLGRPDDRPEPTPPASPAMHAADDPDLTETSPAPQAVEPPQPHDEPAEMVFNSPDEDAPTPPDQAETPKPAPPPASPAALRKNRPDAPPKRPQKPAKPAPETRADTIALQLRSSPEAARVQVAGRPAGTTPTVVTLDRSDDPITVVFSHVGYQSETRRILADQDKTVDVRLKKGRLKLIP